jgi:hypothetical protein
MSILARCCSEGLRGESGDRMENWRQQRISYRYKSSRQSRFVCMICRQKADLASVLEALGGSVSYRCDDGREVPACFHASSWPRLSGAVIQ